MILGIWNSCDTIQFEIMILGVMNDFFFYLKPEYIWYYYMGVQNLFKSSAFSDTALAEHGNAPCNYKVEVEVQFLYLTTFDT